MYPSDFEAKTSHLTIAEDGAYNRLLRICWMTPGCTMPADEAWIMRRARAHNDAEKETVRAVLAEFFKVVGGRYSNARLTREWLAANEAHEKRKKAGAKGGKSKALKTNKTGPSNAVAKPKQPEPEPEPDSSVPKGTAADAPRDLKKVAFDEGVKLLRQGGRAEGQARGIIGKWVKSHGEAEVVTALGKAQREGAIDPVSFCEGVFKHQGRNVAPAGFVSQGAFGTIPERN